MGGQLIAMGMGMRGVFFREHRLFDGFVFRVRERTGNGVVPGIFQLAVPVLARTFLDRGREIPVVFGGRLSWRHTDC